MYDIIHESYLFIKGDKSQFFGKRPYYKNNIYDIVFYMAIKDRLLFKRVEFV